MCVAGAWVDVYPQSGGSTAKPIKALTASATLSEAEFKNGFITLDGTSAVVDVTFPAASTVTGYTCTLKCINSTFGCSIVSTVDGAPYLFNGRYDLIEVISDGTNFYTVG